MIFTAATLASLIAANGCVKPEVAPIIIGIASAESGFNEFAIHDNTADLSFTPSTEAEAVQLAKALLAHRHSIDLGIGQINAPKNLAWTGLTVETAFDPCRNLAAAAKILFVRYNGNPPDAQKIAYAQRVTARIGAIAEAATLPPVKPNHEPQAATIFARPAPRRELVIVATTSKQ